MGEQYDPPRWVSLLPSEVEAEIRSMIAEIDCIYPHAHCMLSDVPWLALAVVWCVREITKRRGGPHG